MYIDMYCCCYRCCCSCCCCCCCHCSCCRCGRIITITSTRIHQKSIKNLPSWEKKPKKSTKNQLKIKKIDLGRGLGGSWGDLGPKTRPRPKNTAKTNFWGPSWGPVLEAKIFIKSIFQGAKWCSFFNYFFNTYKIDFFRNLAPTWHPKPTKNTSMLALKSIQIGAWF